MDEKIIEQLLALNHEFYATFAQSFAASRSLSDPALTSILPHIPQRARVLDVGCGNGRLAQLLDQERPGAIYLGVDAVPELIEVARAQAGQLATISAEFHVADVAHPGWSEELTGTRPSTLLRASPSTRLRTGPSTESIPSPAEGLRTGPSTRLRTGFDRIVILAVLHHIPSFGLRAQVLREAASLLGPNGRLILSTWQFLDSARMRRKITDWAEVSIAEEALEPGDYLLDWKREGRGLRYCHLVDGAEVEHLAAESGLRVRETFRAGGREGNLSLFAILDKNPLCAPK